MATQTIPRMSVDLYLDLDRAAPRKSEYLDGIMYGMAGASAAHSYLTIALGSELRTSLRGSNCRAASSDMRIGAIPGHAYFYPDISVICGEAQTTGRDQDVFTNPVVIFEILSPSTEAFDRGEKFRQYQKMQSLREYVLVSQSEPRIEVFARETDGDKWTRTEFSGMDAVCRIDSIGCEIAVGAVYEGIPLES